METFYFDWSMTRGLEVLPERDQDPLDTSLVARYATIDELLEVLAALKMNARLISESTFESFNIDKRRKLVEKAKAGGHEWLVMPTRQTPRMRNELGVEKDDVNDVLAIRHYARTRPEGLKPPTIREDVADKIVIREAANAELMVLRREYEKVANKSALGFKFVSHKETYAKEVSESLPDYSTLPDIRKAMLGDGKKYSAPLLAVAGVAAKHARNRKDYEYILGLYANGYPCQTRSDAHYWVWRFVKKRHPDAKMTDFRRELRWLYHQLKG